MESDACFLLSAGQMYLEHWDRFGLPSTGETWMYWSGSMKGVAKVIRALKCLMYENRLRAGTVQHG